MRKSFFVMAVFVMMILISGLTQAQAQSQTRSRNQPDDDRQLEVYFIGGLGHVNSTNRFETGGRLEAFLLERLSIGGKPPITRAQPG